jgi:hypothetical protein
MSRLLSVVIPGRNEMFLTKTVSSVLKAKRGDTEIIVVCDGCWPSEPIADHKDITILHFTESVGQRAATNIGAGISRAKFIMKLDAHCNIADGFDVELTSACDYDHTIIPRLYNLHAFDWVCGSCGNRTYQGPTLTVCEKCKKPGPFTRDIIWKPRHHKQSDFMRFDSDLHFQYWRDYESRPESKGDISPVMGNLGACWMMHRDRYWELGGLDEEHGSWGQMGTEISCKSWLSGGQQFVNKKTWYSHMFRTQGGDFGFPYPISDKQVKHARDRSRDLWLKGKWPKAKNSLKWLVEKFAPVPGWEDYKW